MRGMIMALMLLLQAAALPPAYPRPGTTKLFENARVQVWDITWLRQQYPLHRHRYDLTGVYYTDGDRTIVSEDGERRPVHTNAWDTAFQLKGVTHIEEGASDAPLRAVFVELKEPSSTGVVDSTMTPAVFPNGGGKHQRDTVMIAFTGRTPKVMFVTRGTVHNDEGAAGADRLYAVELK